MNKYFSSTIIFVVGFVASVILAYAAWDGSTNYPTSLDTSTELYDVEDEGTVEDEHHDALAQAVIAIETLITASPTDHCVPVGSGTSPITWLTAGTNGQVLVGSTGADPVFATLNCDDGLTCTTGAGTLEIDFDGGSSPSGDLGGTWASPTVTWSNLAEGELSTGVVVSDDIKDDTIDSADYAAASIDNEHLADDAVAMDELDEDGNFTDWTGNWTFATGDVTFNNGLRIANGKDFRLSTDTDDHEFAFQLHDENGDTWRDALQFVNGDSSDSDSSNWPSIILGENVNFRGFGDIGIGDTYSIKNETDSSDDYFSIEATDDVGGTPAQVEAVRVTNAGTSDAPLVEISDSGTTSPRAVIYIQAAADAMANEDYSGIVITGRNAGEAIDQGNPVLWDNTDNEWVEADADKSDCGDGDDPCWPARGIALATGSDGNALDVLVQGVMRHDDWAGGFAANDTIYLSDNCDDNDGIDDDAPSTSGDCVQVIGWAITDDEVYFNFSGHWLEVE